MQKYVLPSKTQIAKFSSIEIVSFYRRHLFYLTPDSPPNNFFSSWYWNMVENNDFKVTLNIYRKKVGS